MHAAACLGYQDVVTDMPQIGMHGSPERCRSRLESAHAERVSAPESQSFTPLREPPDVTLYRCRPPEAAGRRHADRRMMTFRACCMTPAVVKASDMHACMQL